MKKVLVMSFLSFGLLFSGIFTAPEASAASKKSVVTVAKNYIGTPYKYGGTSPKGFDCSGFVGYSYKKVGKSLPRTTASIYKKGKKVKKANLQKGDLIFFETYKKGASHVGIYIGSNQFIHSSSSKGVKVDKLSNSYWKTKYYGAKRI
ncbi:peptidase P60 [Niallia circulans]|jgi:cell wall-associated NlpC family hydrolase|uniref:Peptidase P60 n=1 Tax=Niallia circulans TaxID=1397 RepID=A0A0J1IJE8_NIACI|nr:C40 family peptidase [Niallia circulans]KLV26052.1 peptidase P60 [Niallia circulans]MCM2981442.1 C40 family peptidase [Niallia circulans]MED5099256.1 C40 family peptidase [Niallia circulans]PAD25922.1 peptidase P60 [Niallia circulans]PAD88170.1 peptidase P60 [Niallia circulans]